MIRPYSAFEDAYIYGKINADTALVDTAALLCLVYGKFIEVWRQQAIIQTSQMTKILIANASHERSFYPDSLIRQKTNPYLVRTPLNAIINFMEIALEGPLDKETRDNLSRSHVASKSLVYAINDLLDLTRTEQGHDLIKEEEFNLRSTVRDTISLYSNDIEKKGLMIDLLEAPNFPTIVSGDEMRTRQCVSNVLSNAIKFTEQGGITVELGVVGLKEPGNVDIEIAVQDTGVGMDAEQMDALFRQLEQVQVDDDSSSVESDDERGLTKAATRKMLGLGIAKVGRIIHNSGGRLRVTSEVGKGSRFIMQMPFALPSCPSDTNTTPPQSPQREERAKEAEITIIGSPKKPRKMSHGNLRRNSVAELQKLVNAVQNATTPLEASPEKVVSLGKWIDQSPLQQWPQGHYSQKDVNKSSEVEDTKNPISTQPTPVAEVQGATGYPFPNMKAVPKTADFDKGALKAPLKAPPAPTTNQPSEGKPNKNQTLNILVAEDDPINSLIIKKRMERMGYAVKLTINGQQCADAFQAEPEKYYLILMDMQVNITSSSSSTPLLTVISSDAYNGW